MGVPVLQAPDGKSLKVGRVGLSMMDILDSHNPVLIFGGLCEVDHHLRDMPLADDLKEPYQLAGDVDAVVGWTHFFKFLGVGKIFKDIILGVVID